METLVANSITLASEVLPEPMQPNLIDRIYREEWGRVVAILIRLLSRSGAASFDLAEEVAQEAFSAALEQWPVRGVPANPRAWLVATARHKAVDILRRQSRLTYFSGPDLEDDAVHATDAAALKSNGSEQEGEDMVADDRLRLIFTCCHPALNREAQVALTLRTLCGLSTEQIASAFLIPLTTMAQRLVRAKQKIRDAGIPYRTPSRSELNERLAAVLLVIYLVFNEGYSNPTRGGDLCREAIRLGRLVVELLPLQTEARGLLAMMLLHHARRDARLDSHGDVILLEDQDRHLWHRPEIDEGLEMVGPDHLTPSEPYAIQAAIAAVHMRADRAEHTDSHRIVALYDALLQIQPSPVIELNRAVAVAMAHGCHAGLLLLDTLEPSPELRQYSFLPAARGALLLRIGQWEHAAEAYRKALSLVSDNPDDPERRFLLKKLAEAEARPTKP